MATHRIVYLYRDAANYKLRGEFCVAGSLSLDDLVPHLLDEQYFVPEKVGIPSLTPPAKSKDDHDLHEFEEIVPAELAACQFTAKEFMLRVRAANIRGWL